MRRLSVQWAGLVLSLASSSACAHAPPPALPPAPTVEIVEPHELEDAAKLAHATGLSGEEKLRLLDEVALRGGRRSSEAAQMARAERLQVIQVALDAKDPVTAIASIVRWFPKWRGDPYVAAQRAAADDIVYASCADEMCRYANAALADAATSTPERAARLATAKGVLTSALSVADVKGEPLVVRLKRLRGVIALASQPELTSSADADLVAIAAASRTSAQSERDKVAVLNADEAVAVELFDSVVERDAKVSTARLEGASLFLALDPRKKVRGVYLVGTSPGAREIDATSLPIMRVLAQVMGHPVTIAPPAGAATTSRWKEGATPMVARWKDGRLVELRLGDAVP